MKKSLLYFKDINLRNFIKVLSIVITIFLLRKYFYIGVDKYIISQFGINYIKSDINLDLLAIFIFVGCLSWIFFLFVWRKLVPFIDSTVNIILITLCYIFVIKTSGEYRFEPIGLLPSIKYVDVLFLCFLLTITKFKYYSYSDNSKSIYGFIEDNFNPEFNKDILGRRYYAHQIGLKILGTSSLNKAFVIAINSPWGFGKSGFLLLMEQFFKEANPGEFNMNAIRSSNLIDASEINQLFLRQKNVIIVKYNPWKNFDDRKIVRDFFEELSLSLNDYDSQLSKKVKKYGKYLYKLNDSVFSKVAELSIESISTDQTLTGLFEDINNSIQRIQKRIIVFVDDLDRLTGDELIDILKLIRNTANFRNTIFVVAYDHNYVLNTIEKKNLISSKEDYLHKIVQLEITLPIFQKNILIQFLEAQISEYQSLALGFDNIKLAINEILAINIITPKPAMGEAQSDDLSDFFSRSERVEDSLLFRVFQNIRDVVRFVNSFKLSFESIGQFTDIYEIVLLEILKVKYLSIYQIISNKRFLKPVDKKYEFDFEEFDFFLTPDNAKAINIKPSEIFVVRIILESIFSPKRKIYFRSVKYPRYFDLYFTYQAPKLIQLEKIESALQSGNIVQIIEVIDNSSKDDTFDDLRSFLDSQTDFTTKADFEIVLRTLFYIAKYDTRNQYDTILQIKKILRNNSLADEFYVNNKEEYSTFLLSVLKEAKYDVKARSEIAGDELYKIVNQEIQNDDLFSLRKHKSELQNILLSCLEEKMREVTEFDMELFNYYIKNIKEIESQTRRIVITREANKAMREFIINHAYDYFKKYLLREHPEPTYEGQYFQLDPFLTYYFENDWEAVRSLLISPTVENNFQKAEDEKEFYNFLIQTIDNSIARKEEKFLIKDPKKIELAENYIAVLHRRREKS